MRLKGAPPTFQRHMSTVLSGKQGLKCFAYLDIIIFGENLKIHNEIKRCIWQTKVIKFKTAIQQMRIFVFGISFDTPGFATR